MGYLTSMKETSSDFRHLCNEICRWISIKSDIYDTLLTTSIHGLYDFRHVYREHNMSVDCLSKEALNIKDGLLSYSEVLEGEIIEEGMIQLF